MFFEDNIIHDRSSEPGSLRPIQLGTPRTAVSTASALASYDSVLDAQRLSSQPPDAPKIYRELSPDSLFPHEGVRVGPLQNRLYDAGSPVFEPPVRQHQYVEEGVPEGKGLNVTPEETRIDPRRVKHTESNEQAIKAQEPHIQSILRHYCGDSEDTQLRALKLILKHHGEICRIKRRKRAGGSNGGIESLKTNAVRTFAEHLTHKHLHIPNPFVCFATGCGKVFPYSQDRDRHEKQIHKMYRPKAYKALLKNRTREQSGMPPDRMDNSQSPTQFIEYVGPAQVNPHQTATLRAHHSILPSSKRLTAHHRPSKVKSGAILRSKTPVPNHRVEPYMHGHARSRSSTPHPSREGDRNVSHSIPFNNRIHREADDRGRPIMTGPESHMFRASTHQTYAPFGGMHASVDGVMEGYHATGGTRTQMSHYSAPTAMSQPGSNMVSNPPLIDSAISSSIGYRDPSASMHTFTPPLQLGNHAPMGHAYEQPMEGPTYYSPMYSGMQDRMAPFNTHTRYQHDNHGISGSTQPFHHGHVETAMYQAQLQQPLQDGSLYGSICQNAPTSSSLGPRPQNSTTAMSYTTPHPAQMPMPGHGVSSYNTYPPSGGSHVTNPDELNNQLYYDLLRRSTPSSGSHYTAHGGAGASQYNRSYANTNNSSQQW